MHPHLGIDKEAGLITKQAQRPVVPLVPEPLLYLSLAPSRRCLLLRLPLLALRFLSIHTVALR